MSKVLLKTKVGNKTLAKVKCEHCGNDFFEVLKKGKDIICDECKERNKKIDKEYDPIIKKYKAGFKSLEDYDKTGKLRKVKK